MTQQERKNKTIAAITTTVVNGLLLMLLFLAGGWGFSGEGIGDGEYPGIEVNLGYDDEGTGNIEPMTEVGNPEATDDEDPPAQPVEKETKQPVTTEPQPTQNAAETKTPETEMLTDPKSDVEIKEVKKEEKPVEKTTEKKPVEKDKPVEKKPEEKKPEETKPAEKPKAVYQPKNPAATGDGTGEGKKGAIGNQGDDVGKEGNKGVPGGTEGAHIYKGKPGGGGDGGFGLQMTGWSWNELPKQPKLQETNIRGKIEFEIEIDENGEILKISTIKNEISPAAERLCREELQKLSLVKTSSGQAPARTKGRVVFNLDLQ